MKFIDFINGASQSKTVRWAGLFGALWAGLIGLDWANIARPEFLDNSPWMVAAFGIVQSVMMIVKRAQTTESLADKVKK